MAGFQTIKDAWRELTGKMEKPEFWHCYEWYGSYLSHLETDPDSMVFCVLYDKESPAAILPLKEEKMVFPGITLGVLELPKHPHIRLKDIVFPKACRTASTIYALICGLQKSEGIEWDCIHLTGLLQDSGALALLRGAPWPKAIEKSGVCDCLELGSSYDMLQKGLSKKFFRSLKNCNNRAAAAGQLSSTIIHEADAQEDALKVFLDLEASGWKGGSGARSAIALNSRLSGFYRQLVKSFGALGACEITLLRLNHHPIAALLALRSQDTLYCLKIAYDERYAPLSPGNLQIERLLEYHIQKGDIKYLNFISSGPWQKRWNPSPMDSFSGYIFRRRPKPLVFHAVRQSRRALGGFGSIARRCSG
jgi:hypothetical protein